MNKTLSVVIPYYKETPGEILPLLSSLNNQVGIDFSCIECIMVNDGANNVLPNEFLALFEKLNIRCIFMKENKGPGVARQTGLDNAVGEYVMFCDADDVLHNVAVLGLFLQEIDLNHPDIITSPWLEELYDAGAYHYINHEDEATWMHGKAFRRVFLQARNIRFHEDLRVHEDSYFLALAFAATENKRKILATTYVWKFIPTSITRRNNAAYTYESTPEFARAIILSFERLEKECPHEMQYKVVQFILYNFFTLHQQHWQIPENRIALAEYEKYFSSIMQPYIKYYLTSTPEYIRAIYNQERMRLFSDEIETELFADWFTRLGLTT